MLRFVFDNNEIRLLDDSRLEPRSRDEITKIFRENHDSKLSGHYKFNKTYSKIKERYYWDTMKKDIRAYVRACPSCQINKTNFRPTKQPMEITTTADQPFERLALDVVGPLPLTETGNKFILTMQDDLTKFSFEALIIAKVLTKIITCFVSLKPYYLIKVQTSCLN